MGLTFDALAGHVGERFVVRTDPELQLVLTSVDPNPDDRPGGSLLFRGDHEWLLPQGTYPLTHEELGEDHVFLVPVGEDAGGFDYQAVFG